MFGVERRIVRSEQQGKRGFGHGFSLERRHAWGGVRGRRKTAEVFFAGLAGQPGGDIEMIRQVA